MTFAAVTDFLRSSLLCRAAGHRGLVLPGWSRNDSPEREFASNNHNVVDTMTRSVEELRRESERNRVQLAATVDRLREQLTDTAEELRYKVSPQGIKSE